MGGWNFIDKTGMRWGKLVAKEYLGKGEWKCLCDCGNETIVNSDSLPVNKNRRYIKSCGCLLKSRSIKNIDYFKQIDTEAKAYYLGLLASDGTIQDNEEKGAYTIKLVLQKEDKEILEKLKKEINTSVEVKDFNSTTKLPQGTKCNSDFSSLLLCSKDMVKDIKKYGVNEKKSLTLDLNYNLIPKKLWRHILRGLIDGDGSFGIYGKKKTLSLNLTTSVFMANRTKEIVKELIPGIKINVYHAIGCTENTVRFISTTQKYTFELLKLMYENCSFYLQRKYNNYLNIKSILEN